MSAKRYYSFAGQTVAVRTGTGLAGVSTLVSDPHGTALLSIANSTNKVTRRYTDPFGNARGAKPAWPGDHQMLDKVLDASGLTQVGARFLDTVTGRFVSVDPVLDTANPQQWNAYAYAGNNPVTFSDPSGLFVPKMHPDGMNDAQWREASAGGTPTGLPVQSTSASNPNRPGHAVAPPVKAPVAKKQHWYNTVGNWVHDATADVVNAAASFGNAMINHPWAGTGFIAGVGTMFEGGGTMLGGGLACLTGVGCVVGGPAMALGFAEVVGGGALTGASLQTLLPAASGENRVEIMQRSSGAGSAAKPGWSVGDDIYAPTRAGNSPAWSTVRARFWKNEAADPRYGPWTDGQLARMRAGRAPQRYNPDKGGMESMELSHEPVPFRNGGTEVTPRWPQDHAAIDPFRHPGH